MANRRNKAERRHKRVSAGTKSKLYARLRRERRAGHSSYASLLGALSLLSTRVPL